MKRRYSLALWMALGASLPVPFLWLAVEPPSVLTWAWIGLSGPIGYGLGYYLEDR